MWYDSCRDSDFPFTGKTKRKIRLVLYFSCENSWNSPLQNGIHVFAVYIFYDKMEFPFLDHVETELQVFRNGKDHFLKRKITVSTEYYKKN